MAESELKVPTIVAVSIISLLVGAGIGMLGMSIYYDNPQAVAGSTAAPSEGPSAATPEGGPPGGGPMASGPPGGGSPGGAPGMPGGGPPGKGGGRGPSPKIQLASLVAKLDLLSQKPLTISLDESQKKKVQESRSSSRGWKPKNR